MKVFTEMTDDGLHTLFVRDRMGTAPAGARLFHGGDHWPDTIQFAHAEADAAKRDRDRLQKYLDVNPAKRAKK